MNSNIFFKIFLKCITPFLNFYNAFLMYFLLFFINLFLKFNHIKFANKMWNYCFGLYCTNYVLFALKFLARIISLFSFISYLFLILLFSFIIYSFLITFLSEYIFMYYLYACNKAFIFFLINLFFYFFLYDDKILNFLDWDAFNADEFEVANAFEDGEWQYLGMDLFEESDDEEEHSEIENVESDIDLGLELNDYEGYHLDFLSVDSYDDISFSIDNDIYYDDIYYLELMENLAFFDRWLGLSHNVIKNIYSTESDDGAYLNRLGGINNVTKTIDEDFNVFLIFCKTHSVKKVVEINHLNDLLNNHINLLQNNLLSESIWFQFQLSDPRFLKKNKIFITAAKKKPELFNIQGFKNKYKNRNLEKLSFLKTNKLNKSFYTRSYYDSKVQLNWKIKYKHFQGITSSTILPKLNQKNFNYLSDLFNISWLNFNSSCELGCLLDSSNEKNFTFTYLYKKINSIKFEDSKEILIKKFKLRFYEFQIDFLKDEKDESKDIKIMEIHIFFEQFFRLVLQENFDEEDFRAFRATDLSSTLDLINFFFLFIIIIFPSSLQLIILTLFSNFLKLNILKNAVMTNKISSLLALNELQKRDNILILLMLSWKNLESDFDTIYSNLKFFKILKNFISLNNFEYLYRDLFYSYNNLIDYTNDVLVDEQRIVRREFNEDFEIGSRFLELLNPSFRTYHLTTKYNERSLLWKFDGVYEFFIYLPGQNLNPFISNTYLKNFYLNKKNSKEIFFKKIKILNRFVTGSKDRINKRFFKYLAFYFTRFLFFFFSWKYWLLRFFPYLVNFSTVYAFGGTLVEFNQNIYSNVIRRLYNFGISEPKNKLDFTNIFLSNYWSTQTDGTNPLIVANTNDFFPDVVNVNLNYNVLLKLNVLYNSSLELEFLYFLLFLKRNIFFKSNFLGFFKSLNSHYWLIKKVKQYRLEVNTLDYLFYTLCEDIYLNKLVNNINLKYKQKKYKLLRHHYRNYYKVLHIDPNKRKSILKFFRKKFKTISNKSKRDFPSLFEIRLKPYDIEILGLFLNKFWMNDYYDTYHSLVNFNNDAIWEDGTGGGILLNEENPFDSFSHYNVLWDNIWDWHVLNWEILLHLFNDLDRLFLMNEIEFLEKEEGHFFTLLVIAVFLWFYCRFFKFLIYNDSTLKQKILNFTTYGGTSNIVRFFFENFVQSTGRTRLLGQNYVGQNRSWFIPPFPLASFYMLYEFPTVPSLQDYKVAIKDVKTAKFTLDRFRLINTYRHDLFRSTSVKFFDTTVDLYKLRYNTLSWLLYSRLKPGIFGNYLDYTSSESIDLSLLRDFMHWSKYFTLSTKRVKKGKRMKGRPVDVKSKNLSRLWDRFFFKLFGYYPNLVSSSADVFDKLVDLEYKNYIIRNARRRRMDNYTYEVTYGTTEMSGLQLVKFEKLQFASEVYAAFEAKGSRYISEFAFFNMLRESFKDKTKGVSIFKNRNTSLFFNGFYGSILKNNIQYRSEVRSIFNNTLNRLPKLVNFVFNIKGERRNEFLYTANLSNFVFRLLSEFTDEDFLAFNNDKSCDAPSNFENFKRYSNWFETLYGNPYNFKKYTEVPKINFLNFYSRIINNQIFDKIFLSYYDLGRAFEWWLYLQSSDFQFLFRKPSAGISTKVISFSGNLNAERGLYFLKTIKAESQLNYFLTTVEITNINRFLYLEFCKRFLNRPQYSLFEGLKGQNKKRLYFGNFFRVFSKRNSKKNFFKKQGDYWPYYRYPYIKISLFESLSNLSFFYKLSSINNKTRFLRQNSRKKYVLPISKYRKFRRNTYKDYFMEGLFNLGRQYVDFYENENGYNRQLDLKLGAYGGDFYSPLLNYGSHDRQYQWYLGYDDLFNESMRRSYHIPSWIWSYVLRRHLGYNRFDMPRYSIYQGFVPGFYPTNKVVSKGRSFYGARFFELMPNNFTFEDNQFPSEEGYVGLNLVPTFGRFITMCFMPFNFFFNYIQNTDLFIDIIAPYNNYGDFYKRPRWMVDYLRLKKTRINDVPNKLYETHTGFLKPTYFKFRGTLPSDYFVGYNDNVLFFKILDNIYKFLFFNYKDSDKENFQRNILKYSSRVNVDLFDNYIPLKVLFPHRTFFFSFFSFFFVFFICYLILYYFIWIPIHYLIYSVNHTFDGTFSREDEYMTEDEVMLLTRDLYKDFYILPTNFPVLKTNFDDFYNRSFYVYPELGIFDYLTQYSNYLEYDFINTIYEAPQFDNFDSQEILFYSAIISQFIRNELIDLSLIRIFDYSSLSFNLLDIIDMSSRLFYVDEMKAPLPNSRAFYNEFLNLLIGHELNLTDFLEEYSSNLRSFNKKNFYNSNLKIRSFLKRRGKGLYLGDSVYIRRKDSCKKLKKKKVLNYSNFDKRRDFLDSKISNNLLDSSITNSTVRQTVWSSVLFLREGLKILNIKDSIFLNSDNLYMLLFTEKSNISFLYFSEMLTFLPKGLWGFMRNGVQDNVFIQQYKGGENFLPFYYRFTRIDSFTFSDIKDSNEIYASRFFDLNLETLSTVSRSKLQSFESFFDMKDVGFIHSIHGENLPSELSLSLINNFKTYLDQAIVHSGYLFLDSFAFGENIKETSHYYSKEYLDYFLNDDLDADDWELFLEENRDWFMVYPQYGNLSIELPFEMNPLIFEFEYYKDASVDLKSRIRRTIPFFNFYGLRYNYLRRYAYTYLSNIGISGFYEKIPYVRSFIEDALYEDKFDSAVEMRAIILPDESEYFQEQLEFPDHYTFFSNYYTKYSTDFFLNTNLLSSNHLFNSFYNPFENNIFLHLYLLQFFSVLQIEDLNQRFESQGNKIDLKFEILSSNQHNSYFLLYEKHYLDFLVNYFEQKKVKKILINNKFEVGVSRYFYKYLIYWFKQIFYFLFFIFFIFYFFI